MSDHVKDYAQKLADLTGRKVAVAEVKRTPSTDFEIPLTQETFAEMTNDFLDSIGPITYMEPNHDEK